MLTPVEMQGKELKTGVGYQKKSIDGFLEDVFRDYEGLYRENMELKDKINVLTDGLQYYKDLEKTLQKTLVVAEKAAEETTSISQKKADSMEEQAKAEAKGILAEANLEAKEILNEVNQKKQEIFNEINREKERITQDINALKIKYESYMIQCRQNLMAQIEFFDTQMLSLKSETPALTEGMEAELIEFSNKEIPVENQKIQDTTQAADTLKETKDEEDDIFDFLSFGAEE